MEPQQQQQDDLPTLDQRDVEFCRVYLVTGGNATQAAVEAFGLTRQDAGSKGSRMLKRPEVVQFINDELQQRVQRLRVDADWVLREAVAVYDRCMQQTKVLDRDGFPTGEYTFDPTNALKALTLIGKHIDVKAFEQRKQAFDQKDVRERLLRGRRRAGLDRREARAALEAAFSDGEGDESIDPVDTPSAGEQPSRAAVERLERGRQRAAQDYRQAPGAASADTGGRQAPDFTQPPPEPGGPTTIDGEAVELSEGEQ